MLVSLGVALGWFIWKFLKEENEWNLLISLLDTEKVGCDPDFDTYPQCDDGNGDSCIIVNGKILRSKFKGKCDDTCTKIYDTCPNTFIIWAGPFLVSHEFFS